ncbi:MAG: extracellular solute-binding protein, partial [Verrucomicrobia bacterium]|nr:extracellular solute-binding protein [Verrucomicrobiota bacterium]
MTEALSVNKREMDRRHFLKVAGASIAAAAIPAVPAVAEETVNLVLWAWLPDFQAQVDLFEKAHPNIKVKLINSGQGPAEYTNLRAGLKARSGLPDVCHVEFQVVRSFKQVKALADIGKWANSHKSEFAEWSWNQVSDGDTVYAMPWDSGPIGMLYRNDVFEKHGISLPKTWEEFAEQAIKLHEAAPDTYLTNAIFTDGGWVNSLLWQAGWRPFEVNGTEIS